MGAWGHGPFDNDAVLDLADELTSNSAVCFALADLIAADANDNFPRCGDEFALGFGAAFVIALVRGGSKRYQSLGTTLFAGDSDDRDAVVAYVPEEVRAFIESGAASFDADDCKLALQALNVLSRHIASEGWDDPDAREAAIDQVRAMLLGTLSAHA